MACTSHQYYSGDQVIRMRLAGHVARIADRSGGNIVLLARPVGKRPLGRPRCRWKDNIKVDL